MKKIDVTTSYLLGILFSLAIGFLISIMILGVGRISMITAIIIAVGIFFSGIKKIDTAHLAVFKLFGERKKIFLSEGYVWIIPAISDLEQVSQKIRSFVIGEDIDKGFTVLSIQKSSDVKVKLRVDILISWWVTNPYLFLNIGPDTAQKNLKEMAEAAMIAYAAKNDWVEIISQQETAEKYVHDKFMNGTPLPGDKIGREVSGAIREAESWGIEVIKLQISTIFPADPTFQSILERKATEREQSAAEKAEIKYAIKEIGKIASELGVDKDTAKEIFQSERNKAKVIYYHGLDKGGAILPLPQSE